MVNIFIWCMYNIHHTLRLFSKRPGLKDIFMLGTSWRRNGLNASEEEAHDRGTDPQTGRLGQK